MNNRYLSPTKTPRTHNALWRTQVELERSGAKELSQRMHWKEVKEKWSCKA